MLDKALINNFINQNMIQYKNRAPKMGGPFPFSAYVIRSYSSEPTDSQKQQSHKNNCLQIQKQQEQFYGLIKGWGFQKELIINDKQIAMPAQYASQTGKQQLIEQAKLRLKQCQNIQKFRKNIYRTRDNKFSINTKNSLSPVKKKHISQNKPIQVFFRYQMVSLLTLLCRKQDYINSLRANKKDMLGNPMKPNQIQQKLTKVLEGKGRDKGRQKFNHITNQQLRSLKYKSKLAIISNGSSTSPSKKNKNNYDEDQQEEEQQYQQRQQNIDMQTWKRRNGVGFYQKVFIIKGGYHQLRRALIDRGWYQNQDVWSPHFDFKWTTKIGDIYYLDLKNHQSVNHFNNNHHLTSKYGITRRLRTLILGHGVDVDRFYPRCFDLGDQVDFENFVENFKFGFAETVARRFLVEKKRYSNLQLKIRITADILKKRTISFYHKLQDINKGSFPVISPQQWEIITETTEISEQQKEQKLKLMRKIDNYKIQASPQTEPDLYQQQLFEILDEKFRDCLQKLKNHDPQFQMNGFRNVWIAKPNFMSRGRGIRCFNNIYDIADYCLGRDVQFVVQKYIQHPLVIQGKKFDIRQWVLIQDFNPPKIWFYDECYTRFCGDEFSLDNIYNRQIHLTNNSVQKYNKKLDISKSMWTMSELADYLGHQKWKQIQQKIKNIVVWSIKSCQGHVLGRKGSCQLVGYDFMIDQSYNPWLIEVNMSPSMDYSTPVTKKLVKAVLNDTAKVLSSNKKNRDTGGFQCIYRGNDDLNKFDIYNL